MSGAPPTIDAVPNVSAKVPCRCLQRRATPAAIRLPRWAPALAGQLTAAPHVSENARPSSAALRSTPHAPWQRTSTVRRRSTLILI